MIFFSIPKKKTSFSIHVEFITPTGRLSLSGFGSDSKSDEWLEIGHVCTHSSWVQQQMLSHSVKKLNLRSTTSEETFGRGPKRKFDATLRDFKAFALPRRGGRVPMRKLECKYLRGRKNENNIRKTREMYRKEQRKETNSTHRYSKLGRSPKVEGMEPDSELECNNLKRERMLASWMRMCIESKEKKQKICWNSQLI